MWFLKSFLQSMVNFYFFKFLSVCPSVLPSICLSVYSSLFVSVFLFVYLSNWSVFSPARRSVFPFFYACSLLANMSIYLSSPVCPSVCLYICLCIYLCFSVCLFNCLVYLYACLWLSVCLCLHISVCISTYFYWFSPILLSFE